MGGGDPGGGGGGGQVAVGQGWVITSIEKHITDTVVLVNNYNGVVTTETRTRNQNDGLGGQWKVNNVPTGMQYSIPAGANMSAKWTAEGKYVIYLAYQGLGTPSKNVPIECFQTANAYYNTAFGTFGSATTDNGLGGQHRQVFDYIGGLNNAYTSHSGELKFINASGTAAMYETPTAKAEAESEGMQASVYAEIAAEIKPSNKSLALRNSFDPIMDATPNGTQNFVITFKDCSATETRSAASYVPVPFQPSNTGIDSFNIFYRIGRPLAKKRIGTNMITEETFHHDPNVPFPFSIWHQGSASPLSGTTQSPNTYSYSPGPSGSLPAQTTISNSGAQVRQVDYMQHHVMSYLLYVEESITEHCAETETLTQNFSFKWNDGVSGRALATTELRKKLEIVHPDLFSGVCIHDLRGWVDMTPKMEPGTTFTGNLTFVGPFVELAAGVMDLAAAGGNPMTAALAAIAGITSTVVNEVTEEIQIDHTRALQYKVFPTNWWTHVAGMPAGASAREYGDLFKWQAQLMEASDVKVHLAQKFGVQGFQGMDLIYEYDPNPQQGVWRTLYWLGTKEHQIPSTWWRE
ncbi:MAG: hypothetical protein LCH41_04450 [Armatimonadetes bacterium]|nr:hypothetical protein [Armatimonadota bacterium]